VRSSPVLARKPSMRPGRYCIGLSRVLISAARPRRPQVRPLGGLRPWPDSSSKQSQAPRSAAALL